MPAIKERIDTVISDRNKAFYLDHTYCIHNYADGGYVGVNFQKGYVEFYQYDKDAWWYKNHFKPLGRETIDMDQHDEAFEWYQKAVKDIIAREVERQNSYKDFFTVFESAEHPNGYFRIDNTTKKDTFFRFNPKTLGFVEDLNVRVTHQETQQTIKHKVAIDEIDDVKKRFTSDILPTVKATEQETKGDEFPHQNFEKDFLMSEMLADAREFNNEENKNKGIIRKTIYDPKKDIRKYYEITFDNEGKVTASKELVYKNGEFVLKEIK